MNKIFTLILVLLLQIDCFAYEKTLSICAMFKNEARFLAEWIEYHKLIGVEEFWLYNNNSEDNYKAALAPYIKSGIVHLIEWPSPITPNEWENYAKEQVTIYTDCLNRVRGKSKWLALIDIDEFLFPVEEDNLALLLEKEFSDVPGLVINWIMFGTAGVEMILPREIMISKLIKRASLNYLRNYVYKSIVQPDYVVDCTHPHFCNYLPNYWHVHTNREIPDALPSKYLCIDKIRLHHYWTKDEKFFREVKVPRYQLWFGSSEEYSNHIKNELNTEEDLSMLRFVDRLREAMLKTKLKYRHPKHSLRAASPRRG